MAVTDISIDVAQEVDLTWTATWSGFSISKPTAMEAANGLMAAVTAQWTGLRNSPDGLLTTLGVSLRDATNVG